jgi:hypothetical protein
VTAIGALALTGCFTGRRPTLAEAPDSTGDPASDAVLTRFDQVANSTFTARYDVASAERSEHATATVVQASPTRWSVTVDAIRFVVDGSTSATCDVEFSDCSAEISTAQVGDVAVGPDFYAAGPASQLRADAAERTGPTVASTVELAGQPATCVAVPIGDQTTTYCALDSGALARLDSPRLTVELDSYTDEPDTSAFELPT